MNNCNPPETIYETKTAQDGTVTKIEYKRGKFLGKGGFAKCYQMQYADPVPPEYADSAGKVFAVKIVPKASLIKSKARQKLHSEIKIHKSLRNDLVVIFNKFFEDKEYVFIMLELCPNQTLSELVRRRKRLTEIEAQFYIY